MEMNSSSSQDAATTDSVVAAPPPGTPHESSIRSVIQRFRKASLVLDETHTVTVGGASTFAGILVYTSFGTSCCTREKVLQLARTLLNLPVLTTGLWGDGSEPVSVLDMATQNHGGVAIMLVPQANLISKVKSQGRSIQYHGQCDKQTGQVLFDYLVDCIRAISLEHQLKSRGQTVPKWLACYFEKESTRVNASIPPVKMFRQHGSLYSSFDNQGIPLTNANGEPLSKSALKKLKKQYETHQKRHEKYLQTANATVATCEQETVVSWDLLDDSFIQIVAGSFGKRQGIEMESDMGPFCHVLNL
jgi:D-Tyr-tRNAtyr deacylase